MRSRPMIIGVAAIAFVGAVALLFFRDAGELRESATCKDVKPGGSRLRSASPDAPPNAGTPDQTAPEVEAAFRPRSAQAVYCEDLADPFVLRVDRPLGGRLFVYGTQNAKATIPVLISSSPLRSDRVEDALPALPAWSAPGGVWAPAVLSRGDGLVLYYATTDRASGLQCISRAVGVDPVGPFEDTSTAPLICPTELGGAIDPSPFVDSNGQAYLFWKNDGNCCKVPSRIFVQPLSEDGLALTAAPQEVLASTQRWEGGLVESPSMVKHDGTYYLFYSANAWDTARYAIGYATCTSPSGPCNKPFDRPWLGSTERAAGPGGQEFFVDNDGTPRMVFHAWLDGTVGYANGGFRSLFIVGLAFREGHPVTAT